MGMVSISARVTDIANILDRPSKREIIFPINRKMQTIPITKILSQSGVWDVTISIMAKKLMQIVKAKIIGK